MSGFIDLHAHYIPAIDDGVRTLEDGLALLKALGEIGYERVVATPHIRAGMFENRKPGLEAAFAEFSARAAEDPSLPQLGLGAEHHFDDVFWRLFMEQRVLPYPGGHAILVEFPDTAFPLMVERRMFDLQVKGLRPVLAHPERYRPLFKKTEPLEQLLHGGVLPLLDLMSLIGKYGRKPKKAAERMLEEGVYFAACSDSHRPSDVPHVQNAILRLRALVGDDEAQRLLREGPLGILEGRFET